MADRQTLVQGDTWKLQVGWFEPLPNGQPDYDNPIDLTGYTAKLQVREAPGTTAVLSLTSSPAAGLTVNGALGTVDIRAAPAQTELIDPGTWLWELEVFNGTDRYTLNPSQRLVVKPQVTV